MIHDKVLRPTRMKPDLNFSSISKPALRVAEGLRCAGYDALLVGGCVRDLLLGHRPKDFDLITNATPEQVAREFRRGRAIGRRFRLALVREQGEMIEVSTYRGASDEHATGDMDHSGRIIRDNLFGTREEDVLHRDFTVNALYYDPFQNELIDYVGGLSDIERRVLRCIGEPQRRYREDPVRMLRAVRFASTLDFTLDAHTQAPLRELAYLIEAVPPARRFGEMIKLFHSGRGLKALSLLRAYRLLETLLPMTAQCMDDDDNSMAFHTAHAGLTNTDQRVRDGQPVIAAYLYAVMLWQPYLQQYARELKRNLRSFNKYPQRAHDEAFRKVFSRQRLYTSIAHHVTERVREIWNMQEILQGYAQQNYTAVKGEAQQIISARCFRAAYDFLLLRAMHDASLQVHADWWTEVQQHFPQRELHVEEVRPPYKDAHGRWRGGRARVANRRGYRRKYANRHARYANQDRARKNARDANADDVFLCCDVESSVKFVQSSHDVSARLSNQV